jgi:hypothetical protein
MVFLLVIVVPVIFARLPDPVGMALTVTESGLWSIFAVD